jgi:HEAT repeat protein/lysophospholipase L1-like esterase
VKRSLLLNLALSLTVSVVLLALLEGGARLVGRREPPKPRVADYIWDWDELMPGGFYVMKSDATGWPPWEEFNGDGLRDRTRPHEKPADLQRVAVLGDSVTAGQDIRPEEAYPQLLERRYAAEGRRVEVMNVALWGWSTRQERIGWRRIARTYHPDRAIVAVCLNDIPELFNNLSRPPRWLTWLHERSALVRLVVNAQGREIDNVERLFREPDSRRVRDAMQGFFDEVRALRREVEADRASLAVVVFPFRFQVEKNAPPPVVQERIAAFCREEGLSCLDLLPTLSRRGVSAFLDYDHLSPAGSQLVADTLRASGLLPEGESEPALLDQATLGQASEGARAVRAWLPNRTAPLPRAGVALLRRTLAGPDPALRRAAAWALQEIGPAAAPARDALVRSLDDPSPSERAAAALALGALGKTGRPAVPALFVSLADPSEWVRHAAAQALSRIGSEAEDVPRLVASLPSPDPYVSSFCAWTLGNLGPAARDAVPALARALEREGTDAVVSGALARIGPAAKAAVPVLIEALSSPNADRRWRAARTLGRIGPAAAAAVPRLEQALRDPHNAVRLHSARALGRVGPAARSAAAALQLATGDSDAAVRREARQALDRLH